MYLTTLSMLFIVIIIIFTLTQVSSLYFNLSNDQFPLANSVKHNVTICDSDASYMHFRWQCSTQCSDNILHMVTRVLHTNQINHTKTRLWLQQLALDNKLDSSVFFFQAQIPEVQWYFRIKKSFPLYHIMLLNSDVSQEVIEGWP